jgi:hypothetical protein
MKTRKRFPTSGIYAAIGGIADTYYLTTSDARRYRYLKPAAGAQPGNSIADCWIVDKQGRVNPGDFLQQNGNLGTFDRIVMNPPFQNGQDILHIKHAMAFLRPGGKLVALCANGPRQREQLQPLASHWEDLPAGSFATQGTNVNVALLVIEREAVQPVTPPPARQFTSPAQPAALFAVMHGDERQSALFE